VTIADKTVLVTGANRGIGQALVADALRRGTKRVYAGTRQPLAHPDGRVRPLTLDMTNPAQIQAAALINNAGTWLYDDLSDRAMLEEHLAVNFYGTHRHRHDRRLRHPQGLSGVGGARTSPARHCISKEGTKADSRSSQTYRLRNALEQGDETR
jgi:NAD(P)-dependent dehydrogenase (short-subunit alcohol dehydrogenase family)